MILLEAMKTAADLRYMRTRYDPGADRLLIWQLTDARVRVGVVFVELHATQRTSDGWHTQVVASVCTVIYADLGAV